MATLWRGLVMGAGAHDLLSRHASSMTHADESIVLDCNESVTLAVAAAVGSGGRSVTLSPGARNRITSGRMAFERLIADTGRYVYGASTAPGNRAKKLLSPDDARRQGGTLRGFITSRPGVGGRRLPTRVVRMAILARLTNALTGRGKLTVATVEAVAGMLDGIAPEVPRDGLAGSGEVMALSWLLAPICDLPLAVGEAMALVNGSPFASAMIADVAITARRRLKLAEQIFSLSAEAARIPVEHFSPQLSDLWPEAAYAASLSRLSDLIQGGSPTRLSHQAPVSWRIIPNMVAVADNAINEAERVASISLRSLKDNPTFLGPTPGSPDGSIASGGGYHDHFAGRAIDGVNASMADLCSLSAHLVARLVSGDGLGLPHLLTSHSTDGVGTEFLVWTLTASLARAQQAAAPAGISLSLEDPGGNQSDIAQPAFIAYDRFLTASEALDECLATLAITSVVANRIRGEVIPPALAALWQTLTLEWDRSEPTAAASGEALRAIVRKIAEMGHGQ